MMEVILLTSFEFIKEMVNNAARAGLTCTANTHKLDDPDFKPVDFLKRIIGRGHESIIEHIVMSFSIKGISRALLQELARHRHISLSVESTRCTLGKTLLDKDYKIRKEALEKLKLAFIDRLISAQFSFDADDAIRELWDHITNAINACAEYKESADAVKYFLPELMPTNLVMTCNLRELRHIYKLRANPPALKEFNDLCAAIKATLPGEIKELLEVKNNA